MKKSARFIGRDALESRTDVPPHRRTVYVALRDPDPLLIHDETILLDGRPVGRVTSGSYGYTLGRACGIGYVQHDTPESGQFTVDCGGQLVDADLSAEPFYDPTNSRMKG